MYEKVSPSHPDKLADRIAGAIVDLAYEENENPRIAVEVLLGHGMCHIICETSVELDRTKIEYAVKRIVSPCINIDLQIVPQDSNLANNQKDGIRCGDNGIFKGVPVTQEQRNLVQFAKELYNEFPTDGKYIASGKELIVCQSNAKASTISTYYIDSKLWPYSYVNPLGDWTGGIDVDTGATNRKLGSDMGDSITGAGINGKDFSKADVSCSIYAFLMAQITGREVQVYCAIGDENVTVEGEERKLVPFADVVEFARAYIKLIGGFERFAEWGLIR